MCCALLVACASSLALAPAMLALAPAQTKNTLRFEQMCQRFASHPASTLARVDGERKQLLCRAASSALADDRVVGAVAILYEDLAPVRIAGDLIFKKLESAVDKAAARAPPPAVHDGGAIPAPDGPALEAAIVAALAGWPDDVAAATARRLAGDAARTHAALAGGRRAFDAVDIAGRGALDADALERLGTAVRSFGQCADCTCEKRGSCASVTSLMEEVEAEDGLVFSDFMLGYLEKFPDSRLLGDRNDALVDELLGASADAPAAPRPAPASDAGRKFEAMVDEVRAWAAAEGTLERADEVNPRLAIVLEGCFAGVENDEVTAAFRVVFEDYVAFRLAGRLIFKLMKKLVGAAPEEAAVAVADAAPAAGAEGAEEAADAVAEDAPAAAAADAAVASAPPPPDAAAAFAPPPPDALLAETRKTGVGRPLFDKATADATDDALDEAVPDDALDEALPAAATSAFEQDTDEDEFVDEHREYDAPSFPLRLSLPRRPRFPRRLWRSVKSRVRRVLARLRRQS